VSRRRIAWTAAIGHAFRGHLHHGVIFGTGFAVLDLFGGFGPRLGAAEPLVVFVLALIWYLILRLALDALSGSVRLTIRMIRHRQAEREHSGRRWPLAGPRPDRPGSATNKPSARGPVLP
jgi:hypothetical protein